MDMEACVALKLVHCLERHPDRIAVSELFHSGPWKDHPSRTAQATTFALGDHEFRAWSWFELAQVTARVMSWLDEHHVASGDHVASWMPNGVSWIAIDLACQLLGCVHVAIDARLPQASARKLLAHSHASVLCMETASDWAEETADNPRSNAGLRLEDVSLTQLGPSPLRLVMSHLSDEYASDLSRLTSRMEYLSPDAPAQLLYTSGTISTPKGVVLTNRNLVTNAYSKLDAAPQYADDSRLNILPFCHAYARTCELSTWLLTQSTLHVCRDWTTFLECAPRVSPTLVNLVPHLASKLVVKLQQGIAADELLGNRVRMLQVGGAALPDAQWQTLALAGWPPIQGYGLTETSPVICSNRFGQQRSQSVGPVVKDVEVRLDDEGVLWTRGPHVMQGYWRDELQTRERIQDGWFCTGDLAEQLPDGSWRILGRLDDQITLSTGYKVHPLEIAGALAQDAWIEQLVIVGQNRPHIAALVRPAIAQLPAHLFDSSKLDDSDQEVARAWQRLNRPMFLEQLASRWQTFFQTLPRQMRIHLWAVLETELTVENGGLNFKGGLRRQFIEQHLAADQIEHLYMR